MFSVAVVDRSSQEVELRHPHLWWSLAGAVSIRLRAVDGTTSQTDLGPGEAVCIDPAGTDRTTTRGTLIGVRRDPGAVALGYRIHPDAPLPFDRDGSLSRGRVPRDWEDVLVTQFADSLSYLRSPHPTSRPPVPDHHHPPMPLDPAARTVARMLIGDPSTTAEIGDLASAVFVSPSTLNRRFRAETGLSVGQWRTRLRIAVATEHLRRPGATLESTAHLVGLSSASSLCRVFRTAVGTSPGSSGHTAAEQPPEPPTDVRTTVRSTWHRTNRLHVIVWAYRGTCRATVGQETVEVPEGGLVWLPAGVPNHVTTSPGGMVLPLGARAGRSPGIRRPGTVTGEYDSALLLGAVGREYDPVAPERTRTVDSFFYSFLSQDAGQAPRTDLRDSRLLELLLTEFRRDPSRNLTVERWAEILDCPVSDLQDALEAFGIPDLGRWSGHIRMVTARRLLNSGIPVAAVATHLGYSGTSSFSHVFRRAHGVGPRDYVGYV